MQWKSNMKPEMDKPQKDPKGTFRLKGAVFRFLLNFKGRIDQEKTKMLFLSIPTSTLSSL